MPRIGGFYEPCEDKAIDVRRILANGVRLFILELEIKHESGVTAIAFSPESKILAIGADDYTIQLCDARTGQIELRLNEPDRSLRPPGVYPDGQRVYSLAFSPD